MFRVIDQRDTGKTRKLLEECAKNEGIFVCRHPDNVVYKCTAYGIDPTDVVAIGYEDYHNAVRGVYGNMPIYVDEIENLLMYIIPSLKGYTATIGGKDEE